MSPPQLTGDTPVTDFFQPVEISLFEPFRYELQITLLYRLDGRLGQFFHCHEPLVRQHRFDDRMAAVAFAHRNDLLFRLHQITGRIQIRHPGLPAFIPVHTCIFAGKLIHSCILVDAGRTRQTGPLTDLKVVRVVSRRDLYRTGSLFRIRIDVCDNWNFLSNQRQDYLLADHILISFIGRMHCDGLIGKHGLRSGGCNHDALTLTVRCRIPEIPVLSGFILMLYFRI